jgi:S1-C subfamily serine protease
MKNPASFLRLIGRVTPQGVDLLGTGFNVSAAKVVTAAHVVGSDTHGLVVIMPTVKNLNDYQDGGIVAVTHMAATIAEIDPMKDLVILETANKWMVGSSNATVTLGSLDDIDIGGDLDIYGFPHCQDGRAVLTYQGARLGAKVLLSTHGVPAKHGVVNFQARPGLSGSPVLNAQGNVLAMLVGTYTPRQGGIIFGDINPASLNQTTHIISAEYIKEML